MTLIDRPWVLAVAAGYLLVVLGVGLWSARRTRSSRDFFIAGQRIGLFVTGLATMSAAFSGFVFVGGPGLTYRMGVASLWIVLPVGFTAGMLCWVLGRRMRLLAEVRECFTIPDAIAYRYDSRLASGLAAVGVLSGAVAYLGAQLLALSVVLQAFGVPNLAVSLGFALLVLLIYSVLGGMVAGVYTDVVQGGLMLLAAVAVFVHAIGAAGGWEQMTASIMSSPAFGDRFLEPFGRSSTFTVFGFFFVFGVGVLGQPQMLHKFYMLDDPRKLRFLPLVLGGSQAICLLIWLGIGLAVPALVAGSRMTPLSNPDDAAPRFLLEQTPELLAGIVFAGILAAIMSTADSLLNIGAAALVRDLPRALGRPLDDELRWARLGVLVVAALAASVAWFHADLVALLGTFAFGTFAAALAPALAIGLNWSRVTAPAAVASIATGLIANPVLEFTGRQNLFPAAGVLPSAFTLALSITVLIGVSLCTARTDQSPLADDVAAVMDA